MDNKLTIKKWNSEQGLMALSKLMGKRRQEKEYGIWDILMELITIASKERIYLK